MDQYELVQNSVLIQKDLLEEMIKLPYTDIVQRSSYREADRVTVA